MKRPSHHSVITAATTPAMGLRRGRPAKPVTAAAAEIGKLAGIGPGVEVWIDLPDQGLTAVRARTIVSLNPADIGREVLVSFARGKARRSPVVLGLLCAPSDKAATPPPGRIDAIVDGERIMLTGSKEIVLRCGKASIVLSAEGDVIIKGVRMLAAASGMHRIRGGAVQIN